MNRFFLGVDGGQSGTTALVGDEHGRILGVGRGGPCNHVGASEGRAKFTGAIGGCVRSALEQAGLASARFTAACLGFSGGAEDKEALSRELIAADLYAITHDGLIALVGATAGEPGIITIAGTGSFCFGRNSQGRTARAGGWGYVFGDEGSAFDVVRQALRASLRQEEGWGPKTGLHGRLIEAIGAKNANALLHQFYTVEYPRPVIASFARTVDELAREGDPVAREILMNAAQQLATFAAAVRKQLFEPGEPAHVAWIGGLFRSDLVRERFRMLVELEEGNRAAPPVFSPAAGALIEAYRIAGLRPQLTNLPESEK
jgi:N-acetylglucosamine kinase-like BadF-type ATPase